MGIKLTEEEIDHAMKCYKRSLEVKPEIHEYVRKCIDRRTLMEQEIGECCELGAVFCSMTGEQLAEMEDFCSEKLDYHDWVFEADKKLDDEKYEILKKYVFEHLTIGQILDLYLDITTIKTED